MEISEIKKSCFSFSAMPPCNNLYKESSSKFIIIILNNILFFKKIGFDEST